MSLHEPSIPAAIEGRVFLLPSDLYFGQRGEHIATLLGSCVSITLWHPRLNIGGMCHYLLPERPRTPNTPLSGRYGAEAMQWLLTRIKASHTAPCDYQAKLFGGGAMFQVQGDPKQDIGARNISIARQLLTAAGIPLLAEHVGGNAHRKLIFDLGSGHVWLARKPQPSARAS